MENGEDVIAAGGENGGNVRVLLAVDGTAAASRTKELCEGLRAFSSSVVVFCGTGAAKQFNKPVLSKSFAIYLGEDEKDYTVRNETDRANVLVFAPASANLIAKIATGCCDDLLSKTVRSWNLSEKRSFIAPDMTLNMWRHPSTGRHIAQMIHDGHTILAPTDGKMMEVDAILARLKELL